MSVPSLGSERSCICELDVSILPLSSIFLLYFGNVQTELYLYVGDLSGFMTNLFRTIGFRASKDLTFFGLPFFWPWAYLMKKRVVFTKLDFLFTLCVLVIREFSKTLTIFHIHILMKPYRWVSDCCLTPFQTFFAVISWRVKAIFNEMMMMMSALY